jgi:hypothetical protein
MNVIPNHRNEAMLAGFHPFEDELGRSVTHVDHLSGNGRNRLGRIREVVIQVEVMVARVGGHIPGGSDLHAADTQDHSELRALHHGAFGGLEDADGADLGSGSRRTRFGRGLLTSSCVCRVRVIPSPARWKCKEEKKNPQIG